MGDQKLSPAQQVVRLIWVIGGLFGLAVVSLLATRAGGWIGATGCGLAIILAAFMVGSLLGFLFSVPRVLTQASAGDPARAAPAASEPGRRLLQTNTNLERISDWLTTMLVGVGLSQIGNVNAALLAFRLYVADYPDGRGLAVIAPLMLLFGLIAGFIAMYLYTRIILSGIFNEIETGLDEPLSRRAQAVVAAVAREAQAAGVTSAAIDDVADARAPVTTGDSIQVMFDLLYEPDGYRRVIEIGEKLAGTDAANKAIYWFYLAAAYGQALTDAREREDMAASARARTKALEAATRAVQIGPSYRARLWYLSNPESADNDLAPLRDDPVFRKIVRR